MIVTAAHERRHIGRASKIVTVVRFGDGAEVVFTERIGKENAIKQAVDQRVQHPEYWGAFSPDMLTRSKGRRRR